MKVLSAEFVTSLADHKQAPKPSLPEIAFVGRSNVGKSSLLNCLVNRKNLAKTSGSPGKTRLINYFVINGSYYFVDLPGYGFAKVPHEMKKDWGKLIERYLSEQESLKLIALLVDVRHEPTDNDRAMYRWLIHFNRPTVIVATKADKISRGRWAQHIKTIRDSLGLGAEGPVILFSTVTGQGKDELWRYISQYL
jgi:GTP-binding protein